MNLGDNVTFHRWPSAPSETGRVVGRTFGPITYDIETTDGEFVARVSADLVSLVEVAA